MGKYVENKDYELISDENINEVWNVRILEGEYNEVVDSVMALFVSW